MTPVDVTVVTASIPGRERLLVEAIGSVQAQTVAPLAHLVRVQAPNGMIDRVHLSHQRNQLLAGVTSEWLAILDDDDLYLPYHFEAIAPLLDTDADIIYTFAREGNVARDDVSSWPSQRLLERLAIGNCISSNAAIRREAVKAVGGWDERTFDPATGRFATGATFDDWDMWIRLARADASFCCVPVETWDYRSGDWKQMSR